jgi:HEPN domain-containing protein
MANSDRDHAVKLAEMARRDLQALSNMQNPDQFSEEIFGFHAQQAIEKALKAWIALRRIEYPKTHDISILIRTLKAESSDVTSFEKHEVFDRADEKFDREGAVRDVAALLAHVDGLIGTG